MTRRLHGPADPASRLERPLAYCWSWPAIRRARTVVGLTDGRSESPYETLAQLHGHRLGIRLIPQAWMYDERGCIGRADLRMLSWPASRWAVLARAAGGSVPGFFGPPPPWYSAKRAG